MAAEINALKGQLKLDPKLSAIAKDNKKKDNKGDNKKDKKKKNKKDTSNKRFQKKDEEWKKVPPKDSDPQGKASGQIYLPVVRAPHGMDGPQASGLHS